MIAQFKPWRRSTFAFALAVAVVVAAGNDGKSQNGEKPKGDKIKEDNRKTFISGMEGLKKRYGLPGKTEPDAKASPQAGLFIEAYLEFISPSDIGPAPRRDRTALADATRRQANLKVMQSIAMTDAHLRECLLAIIMDQAPRYCHRFPPYVDRLPVNGAAKVAAPAAAAAVQGKESVPWLDPNAPLDHAALVQNGDVAMELALIDCLKKLTIETNGKELLGHFFRGAKGEPSDPRVQLLALSVLSDGDLAVSPGDALKLLNPVKLKFSLFQLFRDHQDRWWVGSPPVKLSSPPLRLFLISKLIGDPNAVPEDVLEALAAELLDDKNLPSVQDAAHKALRSVNRIAFPKPQTAPNYFFLEDVLKIALNPQAPVATRRDCADTVAYFVTLAVRNKKIKEWGVALEAIRERLAPLIHDPVFVTLKAVQSDPDKRPALLREKATLLVVLSSLWQVVASDSQVPPPVDPKLQTFPPEEVIDPLLTALADNELYKQQPESRLVIVDVLKNMGPRVDARGTYETLQLLLTASTPEEQAAILDAIAYVRGFKKLN